VSAAKELFRDLADLGVFNDGEAAGSDETMAQAVELVAEIEGRMEAAEDMLQGVRELTARLRALLTGDGEFVAETRRSTPLVPPVRSMVPPNLPKADNPVVHRVMASDMQVPQVQPAHQYGPAVMPGSMPVQANPPGPMPTPPPGPMPTPPPSQHAASIALGEAPLAAPDGMPSVQPPPLRPPPELVRPPTSGLSPDISGYLGPGIDPSKLPR